jgi:two-component system sensor histidine kinase/response regulator
VQQRTGELKAANDTKDKLLSIIAHDLRGPIGIVKTLTHELRDNPVPDAALLDSASGSADYAYDLLDDLLQWAASQSGKTPPQPVRFQVFFELTLVLSGLRGMAREKSIDLLADVPEALEAVGDVEMVKVILRNLVINAIKFSHERTQIRIQARAAGNRLRIDVQDQGVGMAPETLAHLFQVGDRKISTLGTRNERGTGLGLILCKEFALKNGGDILVASQVGAGSTFTLVLPLAAATT